MTDPNTRAQALPVHSVFRRMQRLIPYFGTQRWSWTLGVLATLVAAVTEPLIPALFQPLLDKGFSQGALPLRLAANGNIAAWQEASVGSESGGLKLLEVRANVGDVVQRGQVLAVFASESVQADLALARANLAEAQAQAADAAANAERARSLQPSGALSAQQISQYSTADLSARARVQSAQAALQQQELRLKSSLLDSAAAEHEAAVLDTLKQRLLAIQRVELAVQRLDSRVSRWLGDFGVSTSPGSALATGDWQLVTARIAGALKQVWNFELFAVEDSTVVEGKTITTANGVTVGKSIGVLFLYAFAYWLLARLARLLERLMVSRFGVNQQAASVIRRWIMIAVSLVLVVMVLNLARIPLTVFAFMGGALAIGIGFGTQTIIKNVISGIIILFERKIRVGDIIALGGTTGHVTAVDLRASTVRSFDGVEALVPNSTFLENQVVNWTYSNSRIRREIHIGIAYGSPVRQAADIILGCAAEHGQVLKEPAPEVYLEDFADNALAMTLIFWVELSPSMSGRRVDSDLRFMMEKRLGAAGIAIPYPQRDVHLDLSQPLPVRVMPDAAAST